MYKPVVIAGIESKLRRGKIAAKDPNFGLQVFVELRKLQVELQSLPKPLFCAPRIAAANQQIQGGVMLLQQIRSNMRANVFVCPGQEYSHGAPLAPVFTPSRFSCAVSSAVPGAGGICSTRDTRASSGRPSINGYVQRRNAGIWMSIPYSHQSRPAVS